MSQRRNVVLRVASAGLGMVMLLLALLPSPWRSALGSTTEILFLLVGGLAIASSVGPARLLAWMPAVHGVVLGTAVAAILLPYQPDAAGPTPLPTAAERLLGPLLLAAIAGVGLTSGAMTAGARRYLRHFGRVHLAVAMVTSAVAVVIHSLLPGDSPLRPVVALALLLVLALDFASGIAARPGPAAPPSAPPPLTPR